MKLILEKSLKKAKKHLTRYVKGVLLTQGKKSCEGMGSFLGLSHDKLYRSMTFISGNFAFVQDFASQIVQELSDTNEGWLIVDDTAVTKVYSRLIQGVVWMYNVLVGKEQRQFNILVIAWTNGIITIPLDFQFWYPKNLCDEYQTKSEIAANLIKKWWSKVPAKGILGDGHFSTFELLQFCLKMKIPLIAKFASNRKVSTHDGISEQLKYHSVLKLQRNQRSKTVEIVWHGMELFCTVHKRKNKNNEYNIVYYISTIRKAPKEYILLYNHRWHIEKMFRTMKQSLGLKDCSARKQSSHIGHIFGIFHAYTIIQIIRSENNLPHVEAVIKQLRKPKSRLLDKSIDRFYRNFGVIA